MPMMRKFRPTLIVALLLSAGVAPARSEPAKPAADDQDAIRQIIADQVAAWNHADAPAYASAVRQDCVFTNTVGMVAVGKAAFQAQHTKIFATIYKGTRMRQTVTHLRFLAPGIAVLDTDTELSGSHWMPPGAKIVNGRLQSRLEQVLVKSDGAWGITSYHNVFVGRDD